MKSKSFEKNDTMIKVPLSDIRENQLADRDYFGPAGELLLACNTVTSSVHLNALRRRGFTYVYARGENESNEILMILQSELQSPELQILEDNETANPKSNLRVLLSSNSVKRIDQKIESDQFQDCPAGQPLKEALVQKLPDQRSENHKQQLMTVYNNGVDCLKKQMSRIENGLGLDYSSIRANAENFLFSFTQDTDLVINLTHTKSPARDYLITHSLNVSILSMAIASAYGYSEEQVLEIGTGAMLHDTGMVLIPEKIRRKEARINSDEWYEIQKHPVLGLHILEKIKRIPENALLVTYQVNERENGTGYPKQRTSRLIHNYAKIVQIADIYEALSSPRHYRQAYSPHKAVEIILKMTNQHFVCNRCAKAFLEYVALFPVGSYVELNTGQKGKVIKANGSSFTRPVVRILFDSKGKVLHPRNQYEEDLAVNPVLKITKALDLKPSHSSIMQGF
ncbi:MAG: HD-GYP domain-containing protein [Fibrobacterota bacterium]